MTDIFDPNQYKEVKIEINQNKMSKGDELNLAAKDPTLQRIHIGVGWDQNQFDTEPLDMDISCFMLDRKGKTRVNEDFVFTIIMRDQIRRSFTAGITGAARGRR